MNPGRIDMNRGGQIRLRTTLDSILLTVAQLPLFTSESELFVRGSESGLRISSHFGATNEPSSGLLGLAPLRLRWERPT